ncbi:NAD kinase [Collibacillus ludicampi]|jgi:NAD+ kinase|uniref:NAD kinase n=1 Tax=Collibacillus ludicampi TaxID=2771369 RepID=A0AAV4L9R3_9BACL|nr:NAD(+)/NADH kinase [Collibacillus ludicampi]GIM44542.1 NAD kinase [Collibacillus ludicampi]
MKTIGLAVNQAKPKAIPVTKELIRLIEEQGASVYVDADVADLVDRKDRALHIEQFPGKVDLVFVLGGDGTLLGMARRLAPFGLPMLGINVGNLGFLSEAEPDDLKKAVCRVLNGDFALEKRMMLETSIEREGRIIQSAIGLNDIGIAKRSFGRMVTLRIFVDDMYVETYSGDGLIISSPTGSTAYSLSCGGPIVSPHMQVILLTPICPHRLSTRPIVISGEQVVRVEVSASHHDIGVSVDGQIGFTLSRNDTVIVKKAKYETTLIKWKEREFFDVLRKKLREPLDM